jgi:hypothetical protein
VDNLVGEALGHEPGTDDADANELTLLLARLERRIDYPHRRTPVPGIELSRKPIESRLGYARRTL